MPVLDLPGQCMLDFDPQPPALPAPQMPPEAATIAAYLITRARGRANACTASAIAGATGIGPATGRLVRSIIAQYQDAMPCVVCGSPGEGYFVTEDPADMDAYDRGLYATLHSIACRIRAFRRNARRCGFSRARAGARVNYYYRRMTA